MPRLLQVKAHQLFFKIALLWMGAFTAHIYPTALRNRKIQSTRDVIIAIETLRIITFYIPKIQLGMCKIEYTKASFPNLVLGFEEIRFECSSIMLRRPERMLGWCVRFEYLYISCDDKEHNASSTPHKNDLISFYHAYVTALCAVAWSRLQKNVISANALCTTCFGCYDGLPRYRNYKSRW